MNEVCKNEIFLINSINSQSYPSITIGHFFPSVLGLGISNNQISNITITK